MKNKFDISIFPAKIELTVRSYEVDFQRVVNNAIYFNYFELARIDYRKKIGIKLNRDGSFSDGLLFFVVHNECDYFKPAYLDDELVIFTRIDFVKNSSLGFEHLVLNKTLNEFIAKGKGIIVNVNRRTGEPETLPDTVIAEIQKFDKSVKILR